MCQHNELHLQLENKIGNTRRIITMFVTNKIENIPLYWILNAVC